MVVESVSVECWKYNGSRVVIGDVEYCKGTDTFALYSVQ